MVEVILTTDRTMMSNHHHKEFLGFGTTGPPIIFPERFWLWLFAPKMKVIDKDGHPLEAPYGFRKIEAKLIDEGFDAAIIDPDHLHKHVKDAKVLLLSHHDYFGFGPPSSTFASLFKVQTVNARSFQRLMESEPIRKMKKRGVKIIAGGPAAWHWRYREDKMDEWGVDTVIDGEGELIIGEIVEKALKGEELPRFIEVRPSRSPSIDEISDIKYPSVNGLIEIMRGCPRGCKFCSVTLRPLRFMPLEKIEREILLNRKYGLKDTILHSEDVLLYGAKPPSYIIPNREKLIKLHKMAKKHSRRVIWSHASLAAIVKGQRDSRLMDELSEIILDDKQSWWGAEIGIETGSPRLAKIIMPQKAKPFSTDKWPEIVIEGAGIMQDVGMQPAMTLIAGLPEEKEEDIIKTLELVDELWDFKAIIMPMFFVPMGLLKGKDWFKAYEINDLHMELLKRCLTHGIRQGKNILKNYFEDHWYGPFLMPFYHIFIDAVEHLAKKYGYISQPGSHVGKKFGGFDSEKIKKEKGTHIEWDKTCR